MKRTAQDASDLFLEQASKRQKMTTTQWHHSSDIVAMVVSYLPISCLAHAASVCKQWQTCSEKVFSEFGSKYMIFLNDTTLSPKDALRKW